MLSGLLKALLNSTSKSLDRQVKASEAKRATPKERDKLEYKLWEMAEEDREDGEEL